MNNLSNIPARDICCIVFVLALQQFLSTFTAYAQFPPLTWGFYHRAEPLLSAHPQDYFHATGENTPYSGIGSFMLQPRTIVPKTLFHLYAYQDALTHHQSMPPAILRLQTAGMSTNERADHKSSAIEFRVGEIQHPFGLEEQVCVIKNVESSLNRNEKDITRQRGLGIFVQKQDKLGTETDGMIDAMNVYSERRRSINGNPLNEWYPRIGIGNNQPLELLHLGNKLTFHAGGASRIGDNLYFDMNEQHTKRILPGTASSISMHQGSIILSNAMPGMSSDPVTFSWGDDNTLNGIEIDQYQGMSIGKRFPQAALDVMTRKSDHLSTALRIQNNANSTLMHLTAHGALGVYNASPKERVHIGERLTLHAGGASIIGDNVYTDTIAKALGHGRSASLMFQNGLIQLANTQSHESNEAISYQSLPFDENTVRGLIIENEHGHCGIGTKEPKARLDILANPPDTALPALRIGPTSGESMLTITNQGSVGIGTSSPGQPLHVVGNVLIGKEWNTSSECTQDGQRLTVDGAIITKELLITSDSWADAVFEDDYPLMPLEELEQFIKYHKHLPEIPKEEEIHEQGINIAKINVGLLKKIEELTLHIIELNKDMRKMRTMIDMFPIND